VLPANISSFFQDSQVHGPTYGVNSSGKNMQFAYISHALKTDKILHSHDITQEAQLLQKGRAMPRVVEYFG